MTEKEAEPCTRFKHVLPGEHVYEGILFFGYTPPGILDAVKEFQVHDDDVFLATYPKAGKSWGYGHITSVNISKMCTRVPDNADIQL